MTGSCRVMENNKDLYSLGSMHVDFQTKDGHCYNLTARLSLLLRVVD